MDLAIYIHRFVCVCGHPPLRFMRFSVLAVALVEGADAVSSLEFKAYSPWEPMFECRNEDRTGSAWENCLSSKTGILRLKIDSGWSCYTALAAAMATSCSSASMSISACVTALSTDLGTFQTCLGLTYPMPTGSTTCTPTGGIMPAAAEDIDDIYITASAGSASATDYLNVNYAVGDCLRCYQELELELYYSYSGASAGYTSDCTSHAYYKQACYTRLEPMLTRFKYCSGRDIHTSIIRVPAADLATVQAAKLDILAATTIYSAASADPTSSCLTRLKTRASSATPPFSLSSWGTFDVCFEDYMKVLGRSSRPDLALCGNPTAPGSQCTIKDEIAEFTRCTGGLTLNPVGACFSRVTTLSAMSRPMKEMFGCLPKWDAANQANFASCMNERTLFWDLVRNDVAPSCKTCHETYLNAMKQKCTITMSSELCQMILHAAGDNNAFLACAGMYYPRDLLTCNRETVKQGNAKALSLPALLKIVDSTLTPSSSVYEILYQVRFAFSKSFIPNVDCGGCFAKFVKDVLMTSGYSTPCAGWKAYTEACRTALAVPLARFKACAGWELNNGNSYACEFDARKAPRLLSPKKDPIDMMIQAVAIGNTGASLLADINSAITTWRNLVPLSSDRICEGCFRDLADEIVNNNIDSTKLAACMAGDPQCPMGDAIGTFELCSGWRFRPVVANSDPAVEAQSWLPLRCPPNYLGYGASQVPTVFEDLYAAMESVRATYSTTPITDWYTQKASSIPGNCQACFTELKNTLLDATQGGSQYIDLPVCMLHGQSCTAGSPYCQATKVSCPIGFALHKFELCSGFKFVTSGLPSPAPGVTLQYPSPPGPAPPATPFCSVAQWTSLKEDINKVYMGTSPGGVVDGASGNVAAVWGVIDTQVSGVARDTYPCWGCLYPYAVNMYNLYKNLVSECPGTDLAGLGSSACLAWVDRLQAISDSCAIGSATMCEVKDGADLLGASANLDTLMSTGYSLAGNDFMGGRSIFLADYGDQLARATQASLATPPKACFNCFMNHGHAKYNCDYGSQNCATVESDFVDCLKLTVKPLDVKISDEFMPKCDAAEYAAVTAVMNGLDVGSMIMRTETVIGLFQTVQEAISASLSGIDVNPYQNRRCFICHATRLLSLFAAVRGTSAVCPTGISDTASACVAKISDIDNAFKVCMASAVEGDVDATVSTSAPAPSGAGSITAGLFVSALMVAGMVY